MNCLRILQLSDIHLRGDRAVNAQGVDADATLRAALAGLEDVGEIDLMVLGGDLSDDGSVSSYQRLRQLVWDFAGRHGAGGGSTPVVCVPGNHDGRPGFRAVLGSGCSVRPAPSAGSDQRPVYDCRTVDGVRIISLDSSVPGRSHGLVDGEQLDWLERTLAVDAARGTVVVVHHPPVAPFTPLHQGIGLINTQRLVEVLGNSDVRLVLSGHYHHALIDSIAGRDGRIAVVVAAGIINHNQVLAPPGHELAVAGSGAMLIELPPEPPARTGSPAEATARVRILPLTLTPARQLMNLDSAQVQAMAQQIDASPEERETARR